MIDGLVIDGLVIGALYAGSSRLSAYGLSADARARQRDRGGHRTDERADGAAMERGVTARRGDIDQRADGHGSRPAHAPAAASAST